MSYLRIESLYKKFASGSGFAVNEVGLNLGKGEILALTGESGSGKTTLLRMIAGLEVPTSGTIYLDGQEMNNGDRVVPAQNREVGMVFQDYALFPHLNIRENVAYGLRGLPASVQQERVADTLAIVGLTEDTDKYPHQLSGGQQQRVAIARAIAPKPKILLLDEPFSNLDTVLKEQVRNDVRTLLKKLGTTAVLVTHDTEDALRVSDQVAVMHQGSLLQLATTVGICMQPANAYVAKLFKLGSFVQAEAAEGGFMTIFGFMPDNRAAAFEGKVQLCFQPRAIRVLSETECQLGTAYLSGRIDQVSFHSNEWLQVCVCRDAQQLWLRVPAALAGQLQAGDKLRFALTEVSVFET